MDETQRKIRQSVRNNIDANVKVKRIKRERGREGTHGLLTKVPHLASPYYFILFVFYTLNNILTLIYSIAGL